MCRRTRRPAPRTVTEDAETTRENCSMLTIGHSTRPIEEFIGILRAHEVDLLVDVRTVPKSRHNPQYHIENLPAALRAAGIEYLHLPSLGGLRRPRPDSPNTAWRNASFRGYADYMETPPFDAALSDLLRIAKGRRAAIMCAEAVPWRCHRSMIADALTARAERVEHIMSERVRTPHELTKFSRIEDGRVSYREANRDLFET
jgi:uncharacterized protein (DUF488 family)